MCCSPNNGRFFLVQPTDIAESASNVRYMFSVAVDDSNMKVCITLHWLLYDGFSSSRIIDILEHASTMMDILQGMETLLPFVSGVDEGAVGAIRILLRTFNFEDRGNDEGEKARMAECVTYLNTADTWPLVYGGIVARAGKQRGGTRRGGKASGRGKGGCNAGKHEQKKVPAVEQKDGVQSLRACKVCHKLLGRASYSKNQWRKGEGMSRCSKCVQPF